MDQRATHQEQRRPLWITPIRYGDGDGDDDEKDSLERKCATGGQYHVIQRVISSSPNPTLLDAEIQTTLEAFVSPNGETLWRRVAISSIYGIEKSHDREKQELHVSFMLPKQDVATDFLAADKTLSPSLFCWAAFSDRPGHKFLCILVQPSLLGIWDVYPQKASEEQKTGARADWTVGEGNTVALPFECWSIFALGDVTGGIILQRKETKEDLNEHAIHRTWNASQDEDDCVFVLKDPPRPVRWGKLDTSPSVASTRLLPTPRAGSHNVPRVSSLFSLLHPLDDVLPISLLPESTNKQAIGALFTDVFEKVLFVDVLRWTDHRDGYCEKQEYFQTVCVTYHTQLKRHAVWAIKNAPPPPPTPPLWQQSRQWRCEDDWSTAFLGTLDQEDMEILGVSGTNEAAMTSISRDDALADALGVRRTPRRTVPEVSLPVRNLSSVAMHKSRRPSGAGSAGISSFILPSPTANNNIPMKETNEMEVDLNADTDAIGAPPLLSFAALTGLHPRLGMACLYEEDSRCDEATKVFLASNLDGSGTLVICLFCPVKNNDNELRLLLVTPNKDEAGTRQGDDVACLRYSMTVEQLNSVSCVSAQPVQATSVPHCFRPHFRHINERYNSKATDILVLVKRADGSTYLSLNRSGLFIVECSLSDSAMDQEKVKYSSIVDIANPVNDHVDLVFCIEGNRTSTVRGKVSLLLSAAALAERVLEVVDCAIYSLSVRNGNTKGIEAALKLRADCVRLAQVLCHKAGERPSLITNPFWSAVESVLFSIFKQDLVGAELRKSKRPSKDKASAWSSLVRSEFHKQYSFNDFEGLFLGFDGKDSEKETIEDELFMLESELLNMGPLAPATFASMDPAFSTNIFDALHLLYEDFKLSNSIRNSEWSRFLGSFLLNLCSLAKRKAEAAGSDVSVLRDFLDHYARDLGSSCLSQHEIQNQRFLRPLPQRVGLRKQITAFARPPNFPAWVESIMKREVHTDFYGQCTAADINPACGISRSLHRILTACFSLPTVNDQDPDVAERSREQLVVAHMIDEGFTDLVWVRDELPTGIALPLLEVLQRCRCNAESACSPGLSIPEWLLVGRADLCANRENELASTLSVPMHVNRAAMNSQEHNGDDEFSFEDKDKDGIVPIELSSSALFPEDNRVREVGRLLRSSRPVFLRVHRAVEVSDHDFERLKQSKLLLLCQRVLAQPLGRGMFTLGNLHPVPAEPLPVPNLCLAGRVPPTNATLALDLSEAPADMKMWPEFNNGVAAGLRLPLNTKTGDAADSITRSWIVYNKPVNANPTPAQSDVGNSTNQQNNLTNLGHAHGGLLMALGLRGHLSTLNVADVYEYLAHGTMTTTVGVLLGLAANKRGSCDISVSKMLCLHIPTLIPQHFSSSIDVASPVQAAAVAGAGLLFQGSSHRMMTEFFLNELGRRPESDVHVDRDAYTLSCGLALGMINLCQGESIADGGKAGLADLRIEERLHRYVVGGIDDDEMRRRRETSDRFSVPLLTSGESEKSSRIFEGDTINTDVSAPGATLALGLMYMKSGSKTIAACLALPDTHFLLEYVRPDFLMLRVIARALILWDDVQPTKNWIDEQVPKVIFTSYKAMRESVEKATNFSDLSIRSAARAGISNNRAQRDHNLVVEDLGEGSQRSSAEVPNVGAVRNEPNFDRQAVRQIYTHVIAGACFGIGLRFAGTGDKRAASAITECLKELRSLRDENDPVSIALRPERPVLEMCLGCASIALALVLAGSGDLNALRLFKISRWKCDDKVTYGTHMAYSAAIGLLFLGGGTCTLGREPEDIASLVLAFFPRFPSTSSDNLFHLQALRHMYALAVKERELRAVDVDTKESVFVPMEVRFENNDEKPLHLQSPCLLMNTDGVPIEVRIVSDRYYPVRLPLSKPVMGRTIFVKKRSYYLTNSQGPRTQRLLRRQNEGLGGDCFLDSINSTTDDPRILAFAAHLSSGWTTTPGSPFSVFEFCTRALQECLAENTEEALPLYLSLRSAVLSIENNVPSPTHCVWDLRLIRTYYEERSHFVSEGSQRIVNQQLVASLIDIVERSLATCPNDDVRAYVTTTTGIRQSGKEGDNLGRVLTYFGVSMPSHDTAGVDNKVEMEY